MADVINLRLARKARARAAAEDEAAANRARHGRSKADKRASQAEQDRTTRQLEGALREDTE